MKNVNERIGFFNKNRHPKIIKYKYKYMRESLFRFYRGTCHLFYEDLAAGHTLPDSPLAWISGDLHLENFGSYRSAKGTVFFDLNDFDEAVLAPVSWELARCLTSIFVGFESLQIPEEKAKKMASLFLRSYTATLRTAKPDYVEQATARGIIKDFLKAASKRGHKQLLAKRTFESKQDRKIQLAHPKHFPIKGQLRKELFDHINQWLKNDDNSPYNYKIVDVIFRVAGVGSIGLDRFAILLKTLNKTGHKYFMLDMKEASPSSLLPFLPVSQPSWPSEAVRIVSIQQKMQNRCPALLSTSFFRGKHYVMQEMQPTKDSIDFRLIKKRYREMYRVIDSMAILTASAQLRSSGQDGSATTDELKRFAELENWQDQVMEYALQYTKRIKTYYQEFLENFNVKPDDHAMAHALQHTCKVSFG